MAGKTLTLRRFADEPVAEIVQCGCAAFAFCNSPLMNSVEAYVQCEGGLIADDGRVTNESTEQFLRSYMEEFAGFIARVLTVLPRNQ